MELNKLGVAVFVLSLWGLSELVLILAPSPAHAREPVPGDEGRTALVEHLELGIQYLLRRVSPADPRRERAEWIADTIAEESALAGVDRPHLVLAMAFLESSLKPDVEGAIGEWGYMQTHGRAARLCREELEPRGVELRSEQGQIACGVLTLKRLIEDCGYVARDEDLCSRSSRWGCEGALSAYLTGRCAAARENGRVAWGAARRLALAARLEQVTPSDIVK